MDVKIVNDEAEKMESQTGPMTTSQNLVQNFYENSSLNQGSRLAAT